MDTKMTELVKKAQKRDADAFTELMESQMQNMYKAARAILYNDEDVADAISDTILTCWEKMWQLKKAKYFRTWMTRILINHCNDIMRKKKGFSLVEELPEEPIQDSRYENAEWIEALQILPKKYQAVMVLYYVENFSTVEISQMLEMSESTVRSRLARGRKKLAGVFEIAR
ncbi:MAG: RNA polymerase sigma factor [Lachnospiraceae bacterium]